MTTQNPEVLTITRKRPSHRRPDLHEETATEGQRHGDLRCRTCSGTVAVRYGIGQAIEKFHCPIPVYSSSHFCNTFVVY